MIAEIVDTLDSDHSGTMDKEEVLICRMASEVILN